MGSAESREGRRASFGMDQEERVRVLQGIRLSENVVNRMKDPGQPSRVGPLTPPAAALVSSEGREKESKSPRPESGGGRRPSGAEVDRLGRCDREQAVVQDELLQVATRDIEAAARPRSASLRQGEGGTDPGTQWSAQLAGELESREAELRRRDALYKEQLGRLERQNVETYRLSSQQFHKAASKMEGAIKPRRVEPVCSGLQAQILRCYRERLQEVLLCADLVKAYQHCVGSAHKG
ncbi:MICOS complex subunit MIC25 isoform X1 [Physeter macrocephalus]|uniref:MICOS complex subunit MIC25 isoform X1 n=1 Tax=Physeter macrocephalus TaxID=9755 RepID=A0A2Y9S3B2_PHYMC|nr:MICOS complex subunit MIC25 isoform X1 [Physeter catodon]|eukprot:XP_023973071.1 MICOS complex subunit MIC25 isoform X1 [Physeter catodon]